MLKVRRGRWTAAGVEWSAQSAGGCGDCGLTDKLDARTGTQPARCEAGVHELEESPSEADLAELSKRTWLGPRASLAELSKLSLAELSKLSLAELSKRTWL